MLDADDTNVSNAAKTGDEQGEAIKLAEAPKITASTDATNGVDGEDVCLGFHKLFNALSSEGN